MKRIKRILHPTDFSKASTGAFRRAVAMAKAERGELIIAHVLTPPMPMMGDGYISPKVYEEIDASARAHARKQLASLLARARRTGARARTLLLDGVPYEQITRASRRADVVVMGTHGRTGLAHFFLGSVAERVVTTARCPVLTVRGK